MKVTNLTRNALAMRRQKRALLAAGFEEVGEGGGRLWELYRGMRIGYRIVDVKISLDGITLFVKIAPPQFPYGPAVSPFADA